MNGDLSVKGETGSVKGETKSANFLARESVSSSPIVRIFGKGKCKFIANFSAKMVTSLPSLSLSLSLYLSLSLSLSHRKYLTHNIGSASALPIIYRLVFVLFLPFGLIKAGATQTETSLLQQYVAGARVDLLDDCDFPARTITETLIIVQRHLFKGEPSTGLKKSFQ